MKKLVWVTVLALVVIACGVGADVGMLIAWMTLN
jgi:hypothetical protein